MNNLNIAKEIIKGVLTYNNCESNKDVVSLYLQAFTGLDVYYDVEEVADDNGLMLEVCESISINFNLRSVSI